MQRSLFAFLAFASMISVPSALAQNTVFTYQGDVTSGGTNFTGAGQFKFAIVTSTNTSHRATATANAPSGGYITGYNVTFGGNGYVTVPAVTVFGGGGSGATAHASVSGGSVTGVFVDNPGNGNYANAPGVLIAPPPAAISYTTYWSNDGTSVNGSEPSASVIVNVNNGLFSVALGDSTQPDMAPIPASLFSQSNLQLRIWFNDGVHGFAALDPAQNLTAAPYANFANNAAIANNFPSSALSGTYSSQVTLNNTGNNFSGNGSGLIALNANQLTSGQVPSTALNNAWKTTGNAGLNPTSGYFIGTSDNLPLEVKVGNSRALRLEPTSLTNANGGIEAPNVIGGSSGNFVSNGIVGATIAGGGAAAFGGTTNGFNRITADLGTIGGGISNSVFNNAATIAGGSFNRAIGLASAIGGGVQHAALGGWSVVSGGQANAANGNYSAVGGGIFNSASGQNSTISGGANNIALGLYSTTAGGNQNYGGGIGAAVGGGVGNYAGNYSAVPGGASNSATGSFSFAAGTYANASHDGSFVWSDNSTPGANYTSTAINQFSVKAAGGIRFAGDLSFTGGNPYHNLSMSGGNSLGYLFGSYLYFGDGIHLTYNFYADSGGTGHVIAAGGGTSRVTVGYSEVDLAVGAANVGPNTVRLSATTTGVTVTGTFNNSSDRNLKQDFASIEPTSVLEKVVALPVKTWSYKDDPKTRHLGPVAQDFYSTFNIGTDDKHIAPIDEGGVALAAIKGLNEKLTEELARRDAENAELKTRLDKLERLIANKP